MQQFAHVLAIDWVEEGVVLYLAIMSRSLHLKVASGAVLTTKYSVCVYGIRQGSNDLLEENAHLQRQNSMKEEAGVTGAAAFDGAKTGAVTRPKGRKGMDGMMVRQDKSFITRLQDFYVACLKVCSLRIALESDWRLDHDEDVSSGMQQSGVSLL